MIVAGVDIGSLSTKALIMESGKIRDWSIIFTEPSSEGSAVTVMNLVLEKCNLCLKDITYTISTGYGRVNVPFAQATITEISCHARGSHWFFPKVRTVLDMGGQDCKAIRCDQRGKVTAFLMNDKCAAGTGRGMEVFADLLQVHINDVGKMSLEVEKEPEPVSSTCVVFAKSEAVGLLRKGWPKEKV